MNISTLILSFLYHFLFYSLNLYLINFEWIKIITVLNENALSLNLICIFIEELVFKKNY